MSSQSSSPSSSSVHLGSRRPSLFKLGTASISAKRSANQLGSVPRAKRDGMPQDVAVILHNDKRGLLTIEDGHLDILQLSSDGRPPKRLLTCPTRNILRVVLSRNAPGGRQRLDIHVLISKRKNTDYHLSKVYALVEPEHVQEAQAWVNDTLQAAYPATKPGRRVLLFVNPVGGKGKAKSVVHKNLLPILAAAGCTVDLRETLHRGHASQLVQELNLCNYDVISAASGDGLMHEIINGLAARKDAAKALHIPLAPVPTGSANALCISLFGPDDTFNIELAALNIVKGHSIPMDLSTVLLLPSGKRLVSFLSFALGLMVDLDIGTEHLRWMGDSRFVYGFMRGIVSSRNHKCRLRLQVVADDKIEMARAGREWAAEVKSKSRKAIGGGQDPLSNRVGKLAIGSNGAHRQEATMPVSTATKTLADPQQEAQRPAAAVESETEATGPLHVVKPLEPDDTWITIETGSGSRSLKDGQAASNAQSGGWVDGEGILYVYAGMTPWASRDLMQWPVSVQGSGALDMVVQKLASRATMANAITGAEKGETYWLDSSHYYKVTAFTVENLDKKNQDTISIDGEAFPYEDAHVKFHPSMARVLSLEGHFFVSEFLQKSEAKD